MTISKTPLPYLDSNLLFTVLPPAERSVISQASKVLTFSKQQLIYEPGNDTTQTYILGKGTAKITIHTEKKDIIKYMVRPGTLFGEAFLTGELQRRDYAYAMEDHTEVVVIEAQLMVSMMRRNFAFAQSLLYFLGERLRNTEIQLERVVLKDSKSRILGYLHQMGIEQGKQVGMEILVRHNMTHQDIADLTGTSRQMVTAVLNQLKRENLLYFNRKKILFRDLNALPAAS